MTALQYGRRRPTGSVENKSKPLSESTRNSPERVEKLERMVKAALHLRNAIQFFGGEVTSYADIPKSAIKEFDDTLEEIINEPVD